MNNESMNNKPMNNKSNKPNNKPTQPTPAAASDFSCELRLNHDKQSFLGDRRVELLQQIAATGSISQAAKAIGMSYKAAWDAVDSMNNLALQPLVMRMTGGVNGGGTEVTAYGLGLINTYRFLQKEYEQVMQRFHDLGHHGDIEQFMRILSMKTSARNQLKGTVTRINGGAVNGDVIIDMGDGIEIFANITNESIAELGLTVGSEAIAIIKSSFIILSPDLDVRISARNRLPGTISAIIPGAVNCEVKLALAGNRVLTAVITHESLSEFNFQVGDRCCALIKASHVIVATH